jgi:hypothetical protein
VREADARVDRLLQRRLLDHHVAERRGEIAIEAPVVRDGGSGGGQAPRHEGAEADGRIVLEPVAVTRTEQLPIRKLEGLDLHAIAVPVHGEHRVEVSPTIVAPEMSGDHAWLSDAGEPAPHSASK